MLLLFCDPSKPLLHPCFPLIGMAKDTHHIVFIKEAFILINVTESSNPSEAVVIGK